MDLPVLNAVIQGGSFGLLAAVVLWVGRVLIPRIFAEHEKIMSSHRADLKEKDDRHERELAKRDAAFERTAAANEKVAEAVDKLADRVERLEAIADRAEPAAEEPRGRKAGQ